MRTFIFLFGAFSLLLSFQVSSQIAINTTGNPPAASAMLDITSNSKGILVPRMFFFQRDAITNPAKGLLVYQTNGLEGFYYYDGFAWQHLIKGASEIDELSDGRTGGNSVFLGQGAGESDDESDNRNVALGIGALNSISTGIFNTATGYQALFNNTSSRHTAAGYQALYHNTIGESNTANGFRASYSNTIGNKNTSVGYLSNYNNQEGSNNTILGYEAGRGATLHSKSGNVFLGYQAGYSETTDNKLYIENSNSTTPLIYGEFNNNILAVNGRLGVGTQSPHTSSELEIESTTGGILIPRMDEGQRDAIPSPATGLLIYQTDNTPGFYSFDGVRWEPMTVQSTGENEAGEAGIGSNYGTVVNNITGQVWLDRNLGASQVATSSTDALAYGDLYQWGRATEGHEKNTSGTTPGFVQFWVAGVGGNPWDGLFVTGFQDWLGSPQEDLWSGSASENNPCPCGFRIPTNAEWVQEMKTWSSLDAAGALASQLKLPLAGYRSYEDGEFRNQGTNASYWSSTVHYAQSRSIAISNTDAVPWNSIRSTGRSVRCIKE